MSNWQSPQQQQPPVIVFDEQGNPEPMVHFYLGKPLVTYVMLIIIAVMFVIELFTGALDDVYQLIALGAKYNPAIADGQLWRLLSSVFLHGDFMHILFNGYALFIWGPMTERLFGRAKMLMIFVLSGLMGSLASYAFSPSVAVGASGAIFGLLGALLTLRWHDRNMFRRLFGPQLIIILVFNLINGFTSSNIDNFGHLGGLAGGFLTAWMLNFYTLKPQLKRFFFSLLILAVLFASGLMIGNIRWLPQAAAQRAVTALEQGDTVGAVHHAAQAAKDGRTKDEWVQNVVIQSYDRYVVEQYQLGNAQDALEYAQKLVAYAPTYTRGYYMLTVLLCDQGEFEQARTVLTQGQQTAVVDAQMEMADAYVRYTADGDVTGAILALQRALALEPDNQLAAQLLDDMKNQRLPQ